MRNASSSKCLRRICKTAGLPRLSFASKKNVNHYLPEQRNVSMAKAKAPEFTLDEFIAGHEKVAQAADLTVTAITFPGESPRSYAGVYAGFPLTDGLPSATYSDGTKH